MTYTNKSLTWAWLITFGLFVLTGSGVATGSWRLLLFLIAVAAPALILRSPRPVRVTATATDLGKVDVYRWENEGGARRMPFNGGIPEPAHSSP